MKLHLDSNIIEGTPEEIVEYLRLVEGNSSDNQLTTYGHAHQPDEECTEPTEESEDESQEPSTELQVGDKVKVLDGAWGAVGEATVTAVLGDGYVEIAGKDKYGDYLTNWSSHELLLEKIEEEDKSGYYIVNKDNARCHMNSGRHVPKGLVLKHVIGYRYVDTTGTDYLLYEKDLDVCNVNHIEESFKNSKRLGTLLKQGITTREETKWFLRYIEGGN